VVCFPFAGDLVGGSHISALGLIAALDGERFRARVLVENPRGPIADLFASAGIAVEQSPALPRLRHGARVGPLEAFALGCAYPRLARSLRERKVDLVHTNDGRTHAVWAAAAKLARAKLVWHHRGHPFAWGRRYAAPFLADAILSVSAYAEGRPPFGRPGQILHSPFDTQSRFDRAAGRQDLLAELRLPSSARLIGFSGALIRRKQPLLFVEALARLRRSAPELNAHGLIFGEPLEISAADLSAAAEQHGIRDAVHIMGFRTPGQRWIAGCDALLSPAVDEPLGRTLIEAMLARTPLVAANSGGNSEALAGGRLGILVEPGDTRAMADALVRLLGDHVGRHSMVRAARANAIARFSAENHARQVMAVYDRLLGGVTD
jgi:glycosyltransferase involved in cell wall biosynthesis